jgi:phage tail-like protein
MPTTSAPINAVSYVLSVNGSAGVKYSELLELSSEVDPATPAAGTTTQTKTYGTVMPSTIRLRRGLDGDPTIWAWHMAVLQGEPTARKTCTLQLMGPAGQILLTFVLQNAWLATVQITGPQSPPQPPVSTQTDTFICEQIVMQPA